MNNEAKPMQVTEEIASQGTRVHAARPNEQQTLPRSAATVQLRVPVPMGSPASSLLQTVSGRPVTSTPNVAHASPATVSDTNVVGARVKQDECELLVRARYPVLYVVSWEEARVEEHFRAIAARRGKQFHIWSVTGGLREGSSPNAAFSGARSKTQDPVEALSQVLDHKEPAIYLFYDLHSFLHTRCSGNSICIRRLREVSRALTDSYKTLVICSPRVDISLDLEKDVTVVDFDLPGPEEIGGLLDRIVHDVKGHTSISVDLDTRGREALVRAAGGLTLQEAENVFAKTIVADGRLTANDVSVVFSEKQQIVRKSGLLEYFDTSDTLDTVGGMDQLKEWLTRRATAFTEEARAFGLPAPKGVLLIGVQGCGKSLCAKAISRAWNMPLLRFDVGRMFSSLVGSSEENVRRAIAVAESIAPAVLWIDEIDKSFASGVGSANNDGGTSSRVMSTLLTWLSEKTKPVFVLATANTISHLPPELLRKGRLDEIFYVDLPTPVERARIFEIHIDKRRRASSEIDCEQLAMMAEGFSGAEIEQAVISALYDAFALGRDLTTVDIAQSVAETVPLSRTMHESLANMRSWATGRARFAASPATPTPATAQAPTRRIEM